MSWLRLHWYLFCCAVTLFTHAQAGLKPEQMRQQLGRFGLSGHHHLQPIAKLSGGQKARSSRACLCIRTYHDAIVIQRSVAAIPSTAVRGGLLQLKKISLLKYVLWAPRALSNKHNWCVNACVTLRVVAWPGTASTRQRPPGASLLTPVMPPACSGARGVHVDRAGPPAHPAAGRADQPSGHAVHRRPLRRAGAGVCVCEWCSLFRTSGRENGAVKRPLGI